MDQDSFFKNRMKEQLMLLVKFYQKWRHIFIRGKSLFVCLTEYQTLIGLSCLSLLFLEAWK